MVMQLKSFVASLQHSPILYMTATCAMSAHAQALRCIWQSVEGNHACQHHLSEASAPNLQGTVTPALQVNVIVVVLDKLQAAISCICHAAWDDGAVTVCLHALQGMMIALLRSHTAAMFLPCCSLIVPQQCQGAADQHQSKIGL